MLKKIKKVKEVNKHIVKSIIHKELVDVLSNGEVVRHRMKRIQSKLHRIRSYDLCKISLSCFHDKRYINTMALILWLIFIKIQEFSKIE